MFRYGKIGFRPMEQSDIELVRAMHNEASTLLQMGDPLPVSQTQQEAWFRAMSQRRSDLTYVVCRIDSDEIVGVWRLQNVDVANRLCEVGADIFPAYRRLGLGYETYRLLLAYLFEHYNIHTVYLRTAAFNEDGRRLYDKVGFRETGRIVESIFRHGRYWDNIIMCMTVDGYRRLYSSGGAE